MAHLITTPDGRELDLDYFIEWRPSLWRPAALWALGDLNALAGRRVLEYGCRYGRMSCLFGLYGAQVVGVDVDAAAIEKAKLEAEKWDVAGRVQFPHYDGDIASLEPRKFDLIFTKSVLYWVQDLGALLNKFDALLADGGRIAFVENWRGSDLLMAFRRHVLHRRWMRNHKDFPGIRASQLPLLDARFGDFAYRRFWPIVIALKGNKKK